MGLFHKKSKFERLVEPLSQIQPRSAAARSGVTTLGTVVGVSLLSTVVSALRQRKENS